MQQAKIIVLVDSTLALDTAQFFLEYKLPMANCLIYATAKRFNATIWTQDGDFINLPNVRYVKKIEKK